MKTCKWLAVNSLRAGVLAVMLAAAGPAMADTYNILLKDSAGVAQGCATGGFTFTKGSLPGSSAPSLASVTLTGCDSSFVPGIANGTYVPGTLNVVVEKVTLEKPGTQGRIETLDQGLNVEGLSGTVQFSTTAPGTCQGTGNAGGTKTYTITFSYGGGQNPANRTYTLFCTAGQGTFSTTGRYHVRNTVNMVPEPQTPVLVLVALSALLLARYTRRRNS